MATLENINGASLVPDIGPGLDLLLKGIQQGRENDQRARKKVEENEILGDIFNPNRGQETQGGIDQKNSGVPQRDRSAEDLGLLKLMQLNPQMANAAQQLLVRKDARQLKAAKEHTTELLRQVKIVQIQPTLEDKKKVMGDLRMKAATEGRIQDVKELTDFLNMDEDSLKSALRSKELQFFNATQLFEMGAKNNDPFAKIDPSKYTPESLAMFEKSGNVSDLNVREDPLKNSKLQTREIKKGNEIITQELNPSTGEWENIAEAPRFQEKKGNSEKGRILKSSEIQEDRFVVIDNGDGTFKKTEVLNSADVSSSPKTSAVTKVYDNGTTIQAQNNGQVIVKDPEGNEVKGKDRLKVLKQARIEQIEFTQTKAGAAKAGSEAIILSTKTFEKLENLKPAIENVDKAIAAIDAGAKTGAIMSRLPSIKAASIQLDNIQASMGLDVIGNTTFGALSASELDFALSTALPKSLPPKQLKKWLQEKRAAQVKLSDYLENVAIYLGTPGNTVAGWIEAQKSIFKPDDEGPESNAQQIGRFKVRVR